MNDVNKTGQYIEKIKRNKKGQQDGAVKNSASFKLNVYNCGADPLNRECVLCEEVRSIKWEDNHQYIY